MLELRVLFFPQAAFPIKNGSAILISVGPNNLKKRSFPELKNQEDRTL